MCICIEVLEASIADPKKGRHMNIHPEHTLALMVVPKYVTCCKKGGGRKFKRLDRTLRPQSYIIKSIQDQLKLIHTQSKWPHTRIQSQNSKYKSLLNCDTIMKLLLLHTDCESQFKTLFSLNTIQRAEHFRKKLRTNTLTHVCIH